MPRVAALSFLQDQRRHAGAEGVTDTQSLSAAQLRYVQSLRSVIVSCPTEGVTVDDVATRLTEALGEDADPQRFGFERLPQALRHTSDVYFLANSDRLVPCDWNKVMRHVQQEIPHEGVLLPGLVRHIQKHCPLFTSDSLPGWCISDWVTLHFSSYLDVSRSKSSPDHSIFKRAARKHVRRVDLMHRAMELLGYPAGTPHAIDLETILPLLPVRERGTWVEQMLTRVELRQAFHVYSDVMLSIPEPLRCRVLVDGNSLSPMETTRCLSVSGVGLTASDVAKALQCPIDDRMHDIDALCYRTSLRRPPTGLSPVVHGNEQVDEDRVVVRIAAVRHEERPQHSTHDVVVPRFMDTSDEIVAIVGKLFTQQRFQTAPVTAVGANVDDIHSEQPWEFLVIAVGDHVAESVRSSLLNTFPASVLLKSLILCTPTQRLSFD